MQIKLKYIILTCVTLLHFLLGSPAKAQVDKTFQFELAFSPLISWLRSENPAIMGGIKPAFAYGLLFDYNFADNYALNSGLLITHKRGKFYDRITETDSSGNSIYSSEENFRLNYIEFPVALKLKSNEIGYFTYWGKFGLAPAIRIKARDTFKNPLNGVEIENENIIKKDNPAMIRSNLFNISLIIGAGVDYAISGNTKIFGAFIFDNGFLNVLDDDDGEKTILRSVGLQAGLIF